MLQEEGLDGYGGYSLANCDSQSPVCPQPFLPGCCHPHRWQLWHSLSAFCPCPGLGVTFYESTFNTPTQSIKVDGSADYGIFQISGQLWCTDNCSPSDNRCRMACRGTTTLPLQSQPWEPEPSRSAQLQPLAKMEQQGMWGPTWATQCLWGW